VDSFKHLFSQKNILIIDDDPFNCEALKSIMKIIRLHNVEEIVDVCYSGMEAIEKVKLGLRQSEGDLESSNNENIRVGGL